MTATEAVPHHRTGSKWTLPGAVTASLAAIAVYTVVRNPHQPGAFPSCVFLAGSGYYCPGCGGLRAVHDLLHGDVIGALHMNALVVLGIVPALVLGWTWWIAALANDKVPRPRIPTWVAVAIPVLLGVFWVVRNLPGMEFLRP